MRANRLVGPALGMLLAACGGAPPEATVLPVPELPTTPVVPAGEHRLTPRQPEGQRSLLTGRLPTGWTLAALACPEAPLQEVAFRLEPAPGSSPAWWPPLAALSLVSGGTERLPGRAFREEVARLGAHLESSWRQGGVNLRLSAHPGLLGEAFRLLLELLVAPGYADGAIRQAFHDLPVQAARRPAWAALLGDEVPGMADLPPLAEALPSPAELRRWHRQAFHPARAALAGAGPLAPPSFLDTASRWLSPWSPLEPPPDPLLRISPRSGLYWTDREGRPELTLLLPLGNPWEEAWSRRRILARALAGHGSGRIAEALIGGGLPWIQPQGRLLDLPRGDSFLVVGFPGARFDDLPRTLELLSQALRELEERALTAEEAGLAGRGAWCEESALAEDPEAVLDRLLCLSPLQTSEPGLAEAEPMAARLLRVDLLTLRASAGAFAPRRALLHLAAPQAKRTEGRFADARLLVPEVPPGREPAAGPGPAEPAEAERGRELLAAATRALGGTEALAGLGRIALEVVVARPDGPETAESWLIAPGRLERTRNLLGLPIHSLVREGQPPVMRCGQEELPLPAASAADLKADLGTHVLWLLGRCRPEQALASGHESWADRELQLVRPGPPAPPGLLLGIDPGSGLVRVVRHVTPQGTVRDVLLDYRDTGGFRLPFRLERWLHKQRLWVLTVERVDLAGPGDGPTSPRR